MASSLRSICHPQQRIRAVYLKEAPLDKQLIFFPRRTGLLEHFSDHELHDLSDASHSRDAALSHVIRSESPQVESQDIGLVRRITKVNRNGVKPFRRVVERGVHCREAALLKE